MIRKMMFPTDFSKKSNKMYNCIPSFKVLGMKEVLLVHIVDNRDSEDIMKRTKLAKDVLENYKKELKGENLKVKTLVTVGVPYLELIKIAEKEKISLVVITSHGKSMVEKMLLGGVTEKLIYHCKRPVLLEKGNVFDAYEQDNCCDVICRNTFKHVLFPTDWSECANDVLKSVKKFKKYGTESVTVLHVMDDRHTRYHTKEKRKEFEKIDLKKLDKVAKELKAKGFNVSTKLTWGSPFREIKRAARVPEITLITMGVHGKGFVKEVVLGSTADRVTKHAFKPVLLLSHKRD